MERNGVMESLMVESGTYFIGRALRDMEDNSMDSIISTESSDPLIIFSDKRNRVAWRQEAA